MSHLNIRLSSKLLINNGISFKSGGNLHNKLFSFSGTKKYTEDVPREKVLKIESIMDTYDSNVVSDIKVSKDAIIETLAESILNSKEILTVVNKNNEIVGSLNPSKVIKVIFGK